MPKSTTTHRRTFRESISNVDKFLREKLGNAISTLSNRELSGYDNGHRFVRGWKIKDKSLEAIFKVLIPSDFPYGVPRIAIEDLEEPDRDLGKTVPHIEGKGLLCLPKLNASPSNPTGLVRELLQMAKTYIETFSNQPERVDQDFQDEFISYWNRHRTKDADPILSLIDPLSETHEIMVSKTKDGFLIVGESTETISSWHKNRFPMTKELPFQKGLFIKLDKPPIPEQFPDTVSELKNLIVSNAPSALNAFMGRLINVNPYVVIMSFAKGSEVGLIGVSILSNTDKSRITRGFRGTAYMTPEMKLNRLTEHSETKRCQVVRLEHDWVHGRGKDTSQGILKKSRVTILGCGSLGSHTAVRLAQAGVGQITLVDPESLDAANVGRHALGIRHIERSKAYSLSEELRERFPHLKILPCPTKWEILMEKNSDHFKKADLVISTIGEWHAEGPLNEWQSSEDLAPPILYGWMEARASVAHAVLIKKPGPCLQCVLEENGDMRAPDSEGWPDNDGLESEPACGSTFQPYGPIDLAFAEALVSDLAIAMLTGDQVESIHRVHAVSKSRMEKLRGKWTDTHKKFRPEGFNGSFQYERPLKKHKECPLCSQKT
ncbi:MAG TPA: ThiF family adenylyltransferase [Candidatus Paceibacterota bacterium]|nr:ThiF family adenylyltransferase [Candidatus Paceibacterota bacterium]